MRQWLSYWGPAVFCGLISFMALFGSVLPYGNWWQPTFFGFLPMCFVFVGCAMFQMSREVRELRQRLAKLEQKGSG